MTTSLYAMYVQATRLDANSHKTRRRQWIVLPPLPNELAEKHKLEYAREDCLSFYRQQETLENRVKWRFHWQVPESQGLPTALRQLLDENEMMQDQHRWEISPVITAQVTPVELSALQKTPETPYRLLKRFTKVASKVHGLSI